MGYEALGVQGAWGIGKWGYRVHLSWSTPDMGYPGYGVPRLWGTQNMGYPGAQNNRAHELLECGDRQVLGYLGHGEGPQLWGSQCRGLQPVWYPHNAPPLPSPPQTTQHRGQDPTRDVPAGTRGGGQLHASLSRDVPIQKKLGCRSGGLRGGWPGRGLHARRRLPRPGEEEEESIELQPPHALARRRAGRPRALFASAVAKPETRFFQDLC